MYKLISIDIDGTLVSNDNPNVTQRVKDVIKKAEELGTHVVLASGRNYYSMNRILEDLNMNNYCITINGGIMIDLKNNHKIIERTLDENIVRDLCSIVEEKPLPYIIFSGLNIYTSEKHMSNSTIKFFSREKDNVIFIDDLNKFASEDTMSIIMFMAPNEELQPIKELISKKYEDSLNIEYGLHEHLILYPKEMSKGIALSNLADKLGVTMDQVMAIGDAENDISMLKAAGLGVAMGNAMDNVKEHADYITKTVFEDGVAHAIEKFVLNEEVEYNY